MNVKDLLNLKGKVILVTGGAGLYGKCIAEGLAEAGVSILERPDRGASLGVAGREKLEREFSVDACVNAVLDIYEEVSLRGGGSAS